MPINKLAMALRGLRVLEMAGLAPGPFAGLILADYGCDVIRVDRCSPSNMDTMGRSKRSIALDLKQREGSSLLLRLVASSDVLIEPYRPGVMERMGLGPGVCMKLNPRLIYARLTGFGQTGPLKSKAGHDINYLAVSGLLSCLGPRSQPPNAPINLLADFVGGSLFCVLGILSALLSRHSTGRGQVIDASMVDGAAYLSTFLATSRSLGLWEGPRGTNLLDGGAPFYSVYRTRDGLYLSVGALEPQFYSQLLIGLQLQTADLPPQMDMERWGELRETFQQKFSEKDRADWLEIFGNLDACVAPVLDFHSGEAALDDANTARNVYNTSSEPYIPNPAPRLQETPAVIARSHSPYVGEHTHSVLSEVLSMSDEEISNLYKHKIVQSYPATKL